MKRWTWIALAILTVMLTAGLGLAENEYSHKITAGNMQFEWKLVGDTIQIRLSAKTDGWLGIGFNPTTRMKDANFIIGYVKSGKVKVTDHYGSTERQHQKDSKGGGARHVENVSGKEENGITEISFAIPLNSSDPKDRPIWDNRENTILLAYGSGRDSFRTKHAFRTVLKVNLQTGEFKKVK
jgi:hypothetical protein